MKVLFLCTGNSCRSQMAEGLLRFAGGDVVDVSSAGTKPQSINADAIAAMKEMGIDISAQKSKSMQQFVNESFDYVVTLCDDAKESCPVFPGQAKRLHWRLPDPATAKGSAAKRMKVFREIREQLSVHIDDLLAEILDGILERLASQMDAYEASAPPPQVT